MNPIAWGIFAFVLIGLMWFSTLKPKPGPRRVSLMELLIVGAYRWGRWWWCLAEGLEAGYLQFRRRREEIQVETTEAERAVREEHCRA